MKHLKLFFALFAMLALGVGNAWGATYFEDNFSNVGTGTNSFSSRTGWTSLTQCYPQYNTGVRIGSSKNAGAITKTAMTEISGTKDLKVTIYTAKYNSDANSFTITTTNGTITSATGVGTLSNGTLTVKPNGNAGVTSTTSKATWTDDYKTEFIISGASSTTTIKFATNKRAILGPIKIEDAVSEGGDVTEDLGDALKWSADAATVQMGADDNVFPTLTNDKNVAVIYSSSSPEVATIDVNGVVLLKEGTTTISAYYEGGEIDGVTYSAKNVSYTLTVKPAPLVIEPIEGGIIDILTHKTFASTGSYTNFSGKQATNDNHSDAVYAGKTARNGSATQYSIQLNTIGTGRIATTTTGGLAKRVYVRWATQGTLNTNNRSLYIYGSNTAFTGNESTDPSTKIGTVTFTTGATEAYVDLTGDYKYILMTGSGAIYMDEIQVTWVSAAGTVVTPTIHGDAEFVESTEVSISTEEGYKVYYTLDGTNPTNASTEYTTPFTVNTTTTVKAIAYDGTSASDVVSATFKKLQSLTCTEAAGLCTTTESADKYVIRGYVTSIPYPYSATNTTPTFWMADTKDGGNVMQAYKVTPLEEADKAVIVGDQVEVIGKIKLYSETPEVNGGTYTITIPNPKYNVNITSAHGTVTATPASAVEGTEITLSVVVETGWVFQSWTVTDASSTAIEVVDNKFTMPASDVTVVANYTESEAPDAVLKLSANGVVTSNTYKVGETVKLPATIANDCVKIFVGWSADANCATAPKYAPGADFELTAAEHTLYAVYASGTTGETVTITPSAVTGNADPYTFTIDATGYSLTAKKNSGSNAPTYNTSNKDVRVYAKGTVTLSAPNAMSTIVFNISAQGKKRLAPITASEGTISTQASGDATVTWTGNTTEVTFTVGDKANYGSEGAEKAGQLCFTTISVTSEGSFANYSTTCTGALAAPTFSVAEGTYDAAQSVEITATEGTVYYTLDGTKPTSESTQYTEAIVLDKCGTTTIKTIAISSESESPVASATYTISLPIPANDADNPYTGTEAIEVYNGGCYDGETLVYVTGTVQEVEYSSSYGNYEITFADGFQCYRLQKTDTEKFSEDIIGAGDVIVACGKLDKFGSNYQLAAGCYLVKHTPSVKADAELAWNPETVTLTVGDAFTAPTLVNPYSVTGISYESSNDAVATVTAEGVIALVDDAVGTVTITATFAGDATYKPAEVTCTIKVKPIQEDCEGSDDFETLDVATTYDLRKTTAGWITENAAVAEIEGNNYIIINGKTTTVGTITSPVLNGGIGSIKIRYANTYKEDNGVSFQLDIKQNEEVVKTYTITKTKDEVSQNTVYTELIENINVAGDFQMVFTNLHPSNNSEKNKDRVSIGRLCWTNYEEEIVEPTTIDVTLSGMVATPVSRMGRYSYLSLDDEDGNQFSIYNGSEGAYGDDFEVNAYLAAYDVTVVGTGDWNVVDGVETLTATLQVEDDNTTIYNVTATVSAATTITLECMDATYTITDPELNEVTFTGVADGKEFTITVAPDGEGYYSDGEWDGVVILGTEVEFDNSDPEAYYLGGTYVDEAGNTYEVAIFATPAVVEPTPDYTRSTTAGKFGTLCLPFGATSYTGMELYEFVGKEEGKAYLASVTTLEAGVPYIFRATATELAVYSDGTTATAGSHNGLHGTFTDNTEVAVGNYILKDNAICKVTATCWVNANRAYIVWDEIPAGAPQQMPGRRYIGMDVQGENGTTGLDDIMTTGTPVKAIENGQLIIIRDGVKYNVQGVRL